MLAQLTASIALPKTPKAAHLLVLFPKSKTIPNDVPRLHVDPSASRCEGWLGSVASNVTGFGVDWGLHMLPADKWD